MSVRRLEEITLPAAPLRDAIIARGGPTRVGIGRDGDQRLRRAYHRAVAAGRVGLFAGDELVAGLLGCHPAEIWGEAWLKAVEEACALLGDRHPRGMKGAT